MPEPSGHVHVGWRGVTCAGAYAEAAWPGRKHGLFVSGMCRLHTTGCRLGWEGRAPLRSEVGYNPRGRAMEADAVQRAETGVCAHLCWKALPGAPQLVSESRIAPQPMRESAGWMRCW
jgi:hypothetical protein